MSKFSFKGLVSMLSKTKLATETFTTSDGTEITVSSASDEVQVGDAVTLADGSRRRTEITKLLHRTVTLFWSLRAA